jgi:DNA-binding transcriptional ArsR family regulator
VSAAPAAGPGRGGARPEDVFGALADPTRLHILARLGDDGPTTATRLAAELAISRQAVAKHLGQLAGSGLADVERVGREARYRLAPGALVEAADWLTATARAWDGRLARLGAALDEDR